MDNENTFYLDVTDKTGQHYIPSNTEVASKVKHNVNYARINTGCSYWRFYVTSYGLLNSERNKS